MKNIVAVLVCLCLWVPAALGQEKTTESKKRVYRPDIPGFFLVDFGFNSGLGKPANFVQGFWGSRTLNVYYHYPIRIPNSNFTFNPGAGFAFERFKFTNGYTLASQPGGDGTYALVQASNQLSGAAIHRSMLVSNYFDIMPLEIRFDTNKKDYSRGFNIAVGGRIGFLLESHTKIEYTLNGVSATQKDKQSHGLNSFRYGFYTRMGFGNFNWFWHYNLSPYFASAKGPDQTTMNTMTIGISINGL